MLTTVTTPTEITMRKLILTLAATALVSGCNSSSGGGTASSSSSGASTISCQWGADTCDEYGGKIDPTFSSIIQTTCKMHGVAFANAPCPSANQVPGYCDFGTTDGRTSHYLYYSPTYNATSAQT